MKKCGAVVMLSLSLGLVACDGGRGGADPDMVEGGGAYPTATATLDAEPFATDPATYDEAQNMAPTDRSTGVPPAAQPTDPASPAPTPAGR